MEPAQYVTHYESLTRLDERADRPFNFRDIRWTGGTWTRIAFRPSRGYYRKPIALESVWRAVRRCGCSLSYDQFEFALIAIAQKKRTDARGTGP